MQHNIEQAVGFIGNVMEEIGLDFKIPENLEVKVDGPDTIRLESGHITVIEANKAYGNLSVDGYYLGPEACRSFFSYLQ